MAGLNLKVGINVLQATRELRSLSTSISKIGVATKKANRDAAGLARAFGGIGASVGSFAGLLVQATGALAVFGAGAAAASALKFTADFQLGLAEVNTLLKEGDVSIASYEKQLLDLSTQTSKTVDDLSRGLYQTISAGIPAVEGNAGAFAVLAASQKAAVAGLTTTENAVDGIVSVLNAYGRESILATEVSDKLFKTVKLGRIRFDELSRGVGRIAPLAASAGVSLDDVLAVLIQLTRQGVKPSEAVTGLRNILRSIIKPAAKTTKTIAKLNVELEKSGQEQIKFGAEMLRDRGLIGSLKNLTEATGGSITVLSELFPNVRALIPAVASVGKNFEQTAKFQRQLTVATGDTSKAYKQIDVQFSETFAKLGSNIGRVSVIASKGILDRLNKDLGDLNKTLSGKAFEDFAVDSLKSIESFVRGSISLFSDFKESIQSLAVVLASLKVGSVFLSISGKIATATKTLIAFEATVIRSRVAAASLSAFIPAKAAFTSYAGVVRNIGTAALFGATALAGLAKAGLAAGVALSTGLAGAFGLLIFRSNQLVKAFKDIAKNSPSIEAASENIDKSIKGMGPTVTLITDSLANVGARIGQIIGPITDGFGITDNLAKNSARLASRGFTNINKEIALVVDGMRRGKIQGERLNAELDKLAERKGFSSGSEMGSFFEEVNKGTRFDFSPAPIQDDTIGPASERLGALIRGGSIDAISGLKEGIISEDISDELLSAGKDAAVKFLEGFRDGSRGSVQTLSQFVSGLKGALKIGTALSEQQQSELSRKLTLNILQSQLNGTLERSAELDRESLQYAEGIESSTREIESLDRQRLKTSGKVKKDQSDLNFLLGEAKTLGGGFEQLRQQSLDKTKKSLKFQSDRLSIIKKTREELVREREVAAASVNSNKDALNIKQRQLKSAIALLQNEDDRLLKSKEIAEAALKESKRKARSAKISKAITDILALEIRLRQQILDSYVSINQAFAESQMLELQSLKNKEADARAVGNLVTKELARLDVLRDIAGVESAQFRFDKSQADAFDSLQKQAQLIQDLSDTKLDGTADVSSAEVNKLREGYKGLVRQIKLLQSLTGEQRVAEAKRLASNARDLSVLRERLADENNVERVVQETAAALKEVSDGTDTLLKAEENFQKKRQERGLSLLKTYSDQLAEGVKRKNQQFLESFASDIERQEFRANVKFVSSETGQKIDDTILSIRNRIKERLSNLGITGEALGDPLLKIIKDLKEKAPPGLEGVARASLASFSKALSSGSVNEISKAGKSLKDTLEALKTAVGTDPESLNFIQSLDGELLEAVGLVERLAGSFAAADASAIKLDQSFGKFVDETEKVPGKILDSSFQALGDLSFSFGAKISGAIGSAVAELPAVFQAGRDLIDAKLGDLFSLNLESESGFIRGVAGGIVGAANLFVRVTGEGVLMVANLFVKTIGDILTPIGTAISAPIGRLLGSLGAAVGVLADTPEEEDRRDRKEALELQRATLAQLQRSGASNDQIAQEQAALAALLRSQQGDEPQSAAERLEEEINRSVQAALNIAEQLGPLVTQFFQTVTEKLPEVFPLLVKGLVEALDAFGEYFPQFFEILVQEVVDALPDIIAAVIRLIPRLIEALARGLFALIRGLPGILLGVFRGIGEAITIGILKSLSSGIARIFEDLTTGEGGKVTAGLTGGAAIGAGLGAIFGGVPGAKVGAIAGGALGSILGAIFHDGGNVTSGMKNKPLASRYRAAGVQGFLDGGMVGDTLRRNFRASMSDDVPALLQTGEAVLNRSAVSNIGGPSAIDAINSGAGVAPNLNVNVGINPNANGLGQAAAALLPFLIGSISVAGPGSKSSSQNLMGFRGIGGAPLIRQS